MSTRSYQFNFVRKPDDKLKCRICLEVARYPKLHEACGKIFCTLCIEQHGDKPCPNCKKESPSYVIASRSAQRIQNLDVKCVNLENGCRWCGTVQVLDKHLTSCEYERIMCKYHYVGCDVRMMRKDIAKHEEEDDKKHLHLALQEMDIPVLSEGKSLVFRMTEYSSKKQNKEVFSSGPFYTHHNGYKIRVKVYVNGMGSGKESYLSFSIFFLNAPYDSILSWPFKENFFFEVLNQIGNYNHYSRLCTGGEFAQPGGFRHVEQFISHSLLTEQSDKVQLIKNDSIYFRVSVARQDSQSWLTCGKVMHSRLTSSSVVTLNKDPVVFKLRGFMNSKASNSYFVRHFYSHPSGYKMRASIYPNGYGEGVGSHLSLYICITSLCSYNGSLRWPFLGKVRLELLNQQSDTNHFFRDLKFEKEDNIHSGSALGFPKFIRLSKLQDGDRQYLMNDTLYLKVAVQVDSYKPWLICV